MKIAKQALNNFTPPNKLQAILPLVPEEVNDDDVDSNRKASFKLRTVPTDADSPKYAFSIHILDGTDSVRRVLEWRTRVDKIFRGLNITDDTAKHNLIQELCCNAPLTAYKAGVAEAIANRHAHEMVTVKRSFRARDVGAGETPEAYEAARQAAVDAVPIPALINTDVLQGLADLIRNCCPYKALEKQKRFMRRQMRKPADMKIRTYVNHLMRINIEEIPALPPFKDNQQLSPDELIDIVVYGLPKSWINKMDEHNFDPMENDIQELVNFGERLESAEEFDNSKDKKPSAEKKSKKYKSARNNSDKSSGKWCHYHETSTHDTSECETLKRLKKGGGDSKPKSKNLTWKRKSDDAKSFTKKELSAIAKKASREAIKKAQELNALTKRKNDSSDEDSDSDDSSRSSKSIQQELNQVDKQLAEFDFDKSDGKSADC